MAEQIVDVQTLAGMLGTTDEAQQVEAVKKLVELAQAPIITMTVVVDTRTNKTDVLLNGRYSFDEIYALLDITRREIHRREREAILQQKKDQQ